MINNFCYEFLIKNLILNFKYNEEEYKNRIKKFGFMISKKYTMFISSEKKPEETNDNNLNKYLFKEVYGSIFSNNGVDIIENNKNNIILKDSNNNLLNSLIYNFQMDPIKKIYYELFIEGIFEGFYEIYKVKVISKTEINIVSKEILIKLEFN